MFQRFILSLTLVTPYLAGQCVDPSTPAGGFAVTTQLDRVITLSDGYKTRADVVYPTVAPGRCGWPLVIAVHGGPSANGKLATTPENQQDIAPNGFFAVSYDVRGQGLSHTLNPGKGTKLMSLDEWIDMFEVIEWAVQSHKGLVDPNRIGVYGSSQGGWHAWAASAFSGRTPPPNSRRSKPFPLISAVVPRHIDPAFHDLNLPSGTVFASLLPEVIYRTYSGWTLDPTVRSIWSGYVDRDDPAGLRNWIRQDPGRDFLTELTTTKVPTLAIRSWHDLHAAPNRALDALRAMPKTTPKRIYLTTGGHSSPLNLYEKSLSSTLTLNWLRRFLKGWSEPIEKGPPILAAALPADDQTYRDSSSLWRHRADAEYPPKSARMRRFYLRSNNRLLTQGPTSNEVADVIMHRAPVGFTHRQWIQYNRPPSAMFSNMPLSRVRYETAALAADTEIAGVPSLHLSVRPNTGNYYVVAQLYSIPPQKTPLLISSAALGVRGNSSPQKIALEMDVINTVIPAGYKLQLEIKNHLIVPIRNDEIFRYVSSLTSFDLAVEHSQNMTSELDLPLRPKVVPDLATKQLVIPVLSPLPVSFQVRSSSGDNGAGYVLLCSLTGQAPVVSLPGGPLWLSWDPVTSMFLDALNTPMLQRFAGTLDANGNATATLDLAPVTSFLPALVGSNLHVAPVIFRNPDLVAGAPLFLEFR